MWWLHCALGWAVGEHWQARLARPDPRWPSRCSAAALLPCRLQAVQEEAAQLVAQLRSKMIAVPRGQQQLQLGPAGGLTGKRRKSVTFQQRAVSAA